MVSMVQGPGCQPDDQRVPDTTVRHEVKPGEAARAFENLVRTMDRLRSPGGCVWDARQTHESLVKYLVEETYEVIEVIESPGGVRQSPEEFVEELGDVLLQVLFHSRIAQERFPDHGGFTVADVVEATTNKLVRRHPQVFAEHSQDTLDHAVSDSVLHSRWEEVKKQEKPERTGVFDGVPPGLPALQYADKILSKARRHGLEPADPPTSESVAGPATEQELGQQLFDLVRQGSALGLDAERALRTAAREYAHTQRN